MVFGIGTYGIGYVAGLLSVLSPCVLPLLPMILSSALMTHRLGAFALAGGLALSFTLTGLLLSSAGLALGLSESAFHQAAAVLLSLAGALLLLPPLQQRFAVASSGLADLGQRLLDKLRLEGLAGQFLVGLLLGLVWSPCVGPTLGAASTLALQGRDLAKVAVLMAAFGLGAGTPLLVLGTLSRARFTGMRDKLVTAGARGKLLLGTAMLLLGLATLSGLDKSLESWLVSITPDWLTDLTTHY
jgi:cytochrome c biogenesis protein CcdA